MGDHLQRICYRIDPKHPQTRRITSLQVSTLLLEKKVLVVTKFMTKYDNE